MMVKTNSKPQLDVLRPCTGRGKVVLGAFIFSAGFNVLLDTTSLYVAYALISLGVAMWLYGLAQNFVIVKRFYRQLALAKANASHAEGKVSVAKTASAAMIALFMFLPQAHALQKAKIPTEPLNQIRKIDENLKNYHKGKKLTKKQVEENQKIKSHVLKKDFNLYEMCRLALDRHWKKLNKTQRNEFVSVFTRLLLNNAILHSEKHTGEEKIEYIEVTSIPEFSGRYMAKTRVEVPTEAVDFDVHYAMLYDQNKKRWRIYDLILDGESLMRNYQDQFDLIISEKSYAYLVKKMKRKLAESAADKSIQTSKK